MAVKGKPEALAGALRQNLAQQKVAEVCPEPEILAAYYDRTLQADESAKLDLHLSHCASCREQLALLARSDESPRGAPTPALGRGWVWDWRWIVATATLLAVITYVGLRQPAHFAGERSAPVAGISQQARELPPSQAPPATLPPTPRAPSSAPRPPKAKDFGAPVSAPVPALPAPEAPVAQLGLTPPPEDSLKKESPRDLPLNGRNFTSLQLNSPAASKPADESNAVSAADSIAKARDAKQTPQNERTNASANASAGAVAGAPPAAPQPQIAVSAEAAGVTGTAEARQQGAPAVRSADSAALASKGLAAPGAVTNGAAAPRPAAPVRTYGGSQPANLQKTPVNGSFITVKTPDARTVWRIKDGFTLEISRDGGGSWQARTVPATAEILAGSSPSVKVLWVVDRSGMVLLTTDGGDSWKTLTSPGPVPLASVTATSATTSIVIAADGRRFATHDGGQTWASLP